MAENPRERRDELNRILSDILRSQIIKDAGGNPGDWLLKKPSDFPDIGQSDQQWIAFCEQVLNRYGSYIQRYGYRTEGPLFFGSYAKKVFYSFKNKVLDFTW